MSNIFNFLSEETFAEKLDMQNELLSMLVRLQNGEALPPHINSFKDMQTIVRMGLGSTYYPIGSQVEAARGNEILTFDVVAHNVAIPADSGKSHSMTLALHNCPYSLQFDASEPNNPDSNRKSYGNNRYRYSNIRQFLNSKGAAGQWYSAQHEYDAAPSYASTENGFMYGFDPSFLAVLGKTKIKTVIPTVDGGGYEELEDYFYLPSTTEVGLANENSIAEGVLFPYFSSNDRRKKYNASGAAVYWRLRTPYSSTSSRVRVVSTGGTLSDSNANNASGVAPACNII